MSNPEALVYDTVNISICTDCAVWHANADDTGFCWCEGPCRLDDHDKVRNAPGIDDGYHVIVTGDETSFSHSRCDACRRPFGGDRIDAIMMSHHRIVRAEP